MVIGFVVWSMVSIIFVAISICVNRSEKAVGFFTFVKSPKVKDIKAYNKAVSRLWIIFALVLEILGVPFIFAEQNSLMFILTILGSIVLIIGTMIGYLIIGIHYKV